MFSDLTARALKPNFACVLRSTLSGIFSQFHFFMLQFVVKHMSIQNNYIIMLKLNFHLVYLLSFVTNFLLSNSFFLQNGS